LIEPHVKPRLNGSLRGFQRMESTRPALFTTYEPNRLDNKKEKVTYG